MGLSSGDLKNTIEDIISIDEFQPKAGEEKDVIVVAFYFREEEPAKDLNTFIQRGVISTLDVEVSPNTDDEGRYLVFVEMDRDKEFPKKFIALVADVENLTGQVKWKVKPYLSDTEFDIEDPALFKYIILTSYGYKTKDEFKMADMSESINNFFQSSQIGNLTLDRNIVTIMQDRNKIIAEVIDVGDYDTVIGRNALSESAFGLLHQPYEAKVLSSMSGLFVTPIDKFLLVSKGDEVMLLKNTYISHSK